MRPAPTTCRCWNTCIITAEFEQICAPYGCRAVFLTSAEKGDGVEALRLCLEQHLNGDGGNGV